VVRRVPASSSVRYHQETDASSYNSSYTCIPVFPLLRTASTERFRNCCAYILVMLREGSAGVCDVVLSQPIEADNAPIEAAFHWVATTCYTTAQLPVQPALGPQRHITCMRTDGLPHARTYETRKRACGDQDSLDARRALEG
jgi:hypothetical protein